MFYHQQKGGHQNHVINIVIDDTIIYWISVIYKPLETLQNDQWPDFYNTANAAGGLLKVYIVWVQKSGNVDLLCWYIFVTILLYAYKVVIYL